MRGRLFVRCRAVSPVIAALLLIAISVAASVVTYTWVMTMIRNQTVQAQTSIRIDNVEFKKTGNVRDRVEIVVRNTGSVAAVIETLYLTYPNSTVAVHDLGGTVIQPGRTCTFNVTLSAGSYWEAGKAYGVKIVTDNGFTAEGTYYSPNE